MSKKTPSWWAIAEECDDCKRMRLPSKPAFVLCSKHKHLSKKPKSQSVPISELEDLILTFRTNSIMGYTDEEIEIIEQMIAGVQSLINKHKGEEG